MPYEVNIVPAEDIEVIQAVVLAAAVDGDNQVRAQLPMLRSAFEEPYRTVAAAVVQKVHAGEYIDRHILGTALSGLRLVRRGSQGGDEQLTGCQVVNLIFASDIRSGQVQAYLTVLQARLEAKRRADLKERAVNLAKTCGDNPAQMLAEIEQMAAQTRGDRGPTAYPSEMLELIPYARQMEVHQTGGEYLGLNSGFNFYNSICNGLHTGLTVLAAPPGRGKTTLVWQIACQAALLNQVPVIFVSMEQSKAELRAKAVARLSGLEYRHILRGRLRSDDAQNWPRLLGGIEGYFWISPCLTIVEGDDHTTVDTILEVASAKMAQAGSDRCLIVLDYLQILPTRPDDVGRVTSTKDRVDLHVSALRRIARTLSSPVIAISSENRAGYKSKHMDVFKESGGIEYSADIAMVLSRSKQQDSGPNVDYVSLDLNVIKNRNGETGVVKFRFYAKKMEFTETGRDRLVEEVDE